MSASLLYLGFAISMGAILGLAPWIKYEVDDPVGINQFAKYRNGQRYDYIVIGGGTTGSVIASRLSEEPNIRVLLLEAGGDGSLLSDIPAGVGILLGSPMDWQYKNEADGQTCLAMNEGKCSWHRGKALGGTSTINGMLYVRGDRDDYDHWARLGNPGWSYEEILPYFKKSMHQKDRRLAQNSQIYSQGGPLVVETSDYRAPIADAFLKAAKEFGYPVKDLNDGDANGFSHVQATIQNGKRVSSAKAYLRPSVLKRRNLDVVLNAIVTKILINKDSRAFGVQFARTHTGETKLMAYANQEVILSGGAIASPQILQLSGIGPASHLNTLKIHMKKNLPGVGQNMQSHVGLGELIFTLKKPFLTFNPLQITLNPLNLLDYFINGNGPLATPSGLDSVGNFRTKFAETNSSWPDITINFLGTHVNGDGGAIYRRVLNMKPSYFNHFRSLKFKDGFSLITTLLHPSSRGNIKLKSKNPFEKPFIFGNFFQNENDMKTMIEGIKRALALVLQSKAFKKLGVKLFNKPNPACYPQFNAFSDAYWECIVRHFTYTVYHDVGTCKMGPSNDPWAVVNARLQVYGIQGLRVADASIMPTLISGNTQAACYMIAEKISDMIKEDRYYNYES